MVLITRNCLVLNGALETHQCTKPSKYQHTSPSLSVNGGVGRAGYQYLCLEKPRPTKFASELVCKGWRFYI